MIYCGQKKVCYKNDLFSREKKEVSFSCGITCKIATDYLRTIQVKNHWFRASSPINIGSHYPRSYYSYLPDIRLPIFYQSIAFNEWTVK